MHPTQGESGTATGGEHLSQMRNFLCFAYCAIPWQRHCIVCHRRNSGRVWHGFVGFVRVIFQVLLQLLAHLEAGMGRSRRHRTTKGKWFIRLAIYGRQRGGASDVVSMNAPVDLSHKSSHAWSLIAGFTRPPSSARRPGVWRVLHYP